MLGSWKFGLISTVAASTLAACFKRYFQQDAEKFGAA